MILVTAATGQVGSFLVVELSRRGVVARAITRRLDQVRECPGISGVAGAFDDDASMDAALRSIDVMYLACRAGQDQAKLEI